MTSKYEIPSPVFHTDAGTPYLKTPGVCLLATTGVAYYPEDLKLDTKDRKAVNQAARACLPNETEAPIVVTANVRAWRHFLNMRGSMHAEPEIQRVAVILAGMLNSLAPAMFQDVMVDPIGGGTVAVGNAKV